jgi:hypothetical protein
MERVKELVNMKEDLKLGTPWAIYANRVKALLEYDKDVRILSAMITRQDQA